MIAYKCRNNPETVVKRALYGAWKACGGPVGLGFLQDKPDAGEDDVWRNVINEVDYSVKKMTDDNVILADYVFGRMMKTRLKYDKENIYYPDSDLNSEYQGWYPFYKSYEQLLKEADQQLG